MMYETSLICASHIFQFFYCWLFYLHRNFTEISSRFPYLVNLSLASCGLASGLPASIGSAKILTNLDLSNNAFSGNIPESLGDLAYLTTFNAR